MPASNRDRAHHPGMRYHPRREEAVGAPGKWLRPTRGGLRTWHRVVGAHAFEDFDINGQPVKGVIVSTICGQKWRWAYADFSNDELPPGPVHLGCQRVIDQSRAKGQDDGQ